MDRQRIDRLIDMRCLRRTDDRRRHARLMQHPGERYLGRTYTSGRKY
jgi:hypothetical protein